MPRGTDNFSQERFNSGLQTARINRLKLAISKRYKAGETPYTSKELARLMDNLYGTNYLKDHK